MRIHPSNEWYEKWLDSDDSNCLAGNPNFFQELSQDPAFVPYNDNDIAHTEGNLEDFEDYGECECKDCKMQREWVERKYRQDHL